MTFLQFLENYVSLDLFILIILGGIFITKYTKRITKINDTYKVFFASIILSVAIYFINEGTRSDLTVYLITYFISTSFYELFVKYLTRIIKNKFSDNLQNKTGGELPIEDDEEGGT